MDFLVRWNYCRVYELSEVQRAALLEGERSRGQELFSQAIIRQLWGRLYTATAGSAKQARTSGGGNLDVSSTARRRAGSCVPVRR